MKQRVLSLFVLLCMVCTGAWADVAELSNKRIKEVKACTQTIESGKWYVISNVRKRETSYATPTPVYDQGAGQALKRESEGQTVRTILTVGRSASEIAKYLVRFDSHPSISGTKRAQYGTGNYVAPLSSENNSTDVTTHASNAAGLQVYGATQTKSSYAGNPYTNAGVGINFSTGTGNYGKLWDGNGADYTVLVWNDGQITSDANNVWYVEEVELEEISAQTYTIHILGLPSTEGISVTYDGQAKSDGAEVVGAGLTASAFTNATTVAGYTPTITVSGTNVNVKYQRDDVSFDSTTEYTTNDVRFQRAITSITVGSTTKNIAEYDPITSGTSFKAYRDLTESVIFTVDVNQANLTLAVGVPGGTSDHISWTGAYFYLSNAQSTPFAQVVPVNGRFDLTSTTFTAPSEAGRYRVRIVHSTNNNSSADKAYTGTNSFTTSTGYRIVDFTLVVEDKDWDAYNTKLTFLNQVVLGTKLGQYTCEVNGREVTVAELSMYKGAWQDAYDERDNSFYEINIDEMDSYIAGMRLNMPQDGTFIRIHGYGDATSKYLLGTESANSKLNVGGRNDGGGKDAVFYYKDGKLLAYTNGQYVDHVIVNNGGEIKVASLAAVGESAATVTFREDPGPEAAVYNVKVNGDTQWIGASATEAAASAGNRDGSGWRLQLEEANELPVAIGSTGFATFYTPVNVVVPPSITAYVCHLEGENLSVYTCKQTTNIDGTDYVVIPAETAVMLKGSTGNMLIRENVEAEAYSNNSFFGDVRTKAFNSMDAATYYSLQRDNAANDDTVGFFIKPSGNFKGFQAFLKTEASQQVQRFNVTFDEDAVVTGFANVLGNVNITIPAFDLSGRKVDANTHRGLYIMNGKKVIR